MIVSLSSFQIYPAINGGYDPDNLEVRWWYNRGFIDSTTVSVQGGNGQAGFYITSSCTVDINGIITVPTTSIFSTLDAIDPAPQSIQIFGRLYSNNSPRQYVTAFSSTPTGWVVQDSTPLTYEELVLQNQSIVLANPPQTFPTFAQMIAYINSLVPTPLASDVIIGRSRLSIAPVSALDPVALGENDRRVGSYFNIIAYGAVGDGTTDSTTAVNNAIAAALAAGGGIYIPVGTFAVNNVTVTVPIMFAPGNSILKHTGGTITIVKSIIADTSKHFIATAGQVSFGGNVYFTELFPEWWGAVADGVTACQAAFDAAIAALSTLSPGINGGIIRLGVGNYLVTGLTITDVQAHLIGSGGIGEAGSTNTASTIITSASNAPILKYGQGTFHSYRCRLENINFRGSASAGTSQHGVWVDNGGIILNNVSINTPGGHGLLLTRSDVGAYSNLEVHESNLDSILLNSTLSSGIGSTQLNNFVNITIGGYAQTALHIVTGHGNMVFGLDVENGVGRPIWFDRDASVTSEVTYNFIYGFWEEGNSGNVEFNGASQNNYVQFVHPDYTPTVTAGSPGVGNRFDSVAPYGTSATARFGQMIIGDDAASVAGVSGLTITIGNLNFNDSSQMLTWGASLAKLGVTSSTNINFVDSTGTDAGSINLGPSTAAFTQLLRTGTGISVRNGDNSADGPLIAQSVRGVAVAFASLPSPAVEGMLVAVTDSNTAVWGANIAGGGVNHVLAYYNGTNWTVAAK